MNKAFDYIKAVFMIIGILLMIVITLGLCIPYRLGADPLPANAELKYRRRGWIIFAVGYLINAAALIGLFYQQEGGIICGASVAVILSLVAWSIGRGDYSYKMEFGEQD